MPLTAEKDALMLNWCELTVTRPKGEVLYHNAFATDFEITPNNVQSIVATARARWKVENEINNVLKNRGYHLERHLRHRTKHLSTLLASVHILAFLRSTLLQFCPKKYSLNHPHRPPLPPQERNRPRD